MTKKVAALPTWSAVASLPSNHPAEHFLSPFLSTHKKYVYEILHRQTK
jgi:hypothetical protein